MRGKCSDGASAVADCCVRVRALFAVKSLHGESIDLSHAEVAQAMNCSPRQAIRVCRELEDHDYIEVARRRNHRNRYSLKVPEVDEPVVPVAIKAAPIPAHPCPKCARACRSTANSGWCRGCVRELEDRRAVMAAYSATPSATEQEIWSAVKIGENTRRAAGIRKAIRDFKREKTA